MNAHIHTHVHTRLYSPVCLPACLPDFKRRNKNQNNVVACLPLILVLACFVYGLYELFNQFLIYLLFFCFLLSYPLLSNMHDMCIYTYKCTYVDWLVATKTTCRVASVSSSCPPNQAVSSDNSYKRKISKTVGGSSGAAAVVGDVQKSTKAHANTVLLKSVSAFLASSKRNSSNPSKPSEVSLKTKRRLKQDKMDELSGKISPKLLEQLRKKTRFNK